MLKSFRPGEPKITELNWEEKHPIDYLLGPSDEDLNWLENKIKEDEKSISELSIQEQSENQRE